jgi:hypothetical protein
MEGSYFSFKGGVMQFEYTDHEYRTECLDGCGAVTVWMQSRMVANQAGKNHETALRHRWTVSQRMKEKDKGFVNDGVSHCTCRPDE